MSKYFRILILVIVVEMLVWALEKLIRSVISLLKILRIEKKGVPARSESMAFLSRLENEAEADRLGIQEPVDFCYVMTLLRYYIKDGPDGKEILPIDDRKVIADELELFYSMYGRYPKPLNDNRFSVEEYSGGWPYFLMWEVYYLIEDTSFLGSLEDIRSFVSPSVVSGIPVAKDLEIGLDNFYREIHEKRFAEYE